MTDGRALPGRGVPAAGQGASVRHGRGPGDGQRGGGRGVGHRDGEAAHAELLLAVVDRVPALAGRGELREERVDVGDRLVRRGRHADAAHDLAHRLVGELGEDRLADARAVRVDAPADLGEHPHRVARRRLGDVDRHVAVDHREVRRLAEVVGEALQVGARAGAELAARRLAEPDEARAEGVPPRRRLAHVALGEQRAQQAVDRGQGEPRVLRELAQAGLAAEVGEQLEQLDRAVHRLHAPGRLRRPRARGALRRLRRRRGLGHLTISCPPGAARRRAHLA